MRVDRTWLIGDPHHGRNFSNGTPLHRRGDREKMQRAQFIEELATPDVDKIVMVGDLFDRPIVPLPVLSQVISDVVDAAQSRPVVEFIYMAGNHDLSRQLGVKGAWQIFELAVGWLDNVWVVNEPCFHGDLALFPWQWGVSTVDQVEALGPASGVSAVIGHFDMKSFGGDDSHLCPVRNLQVNFGQDVAIYSGHYHEERDYEIDGVTVHCTGSLQPYAHGEGDMYVTMTVEEALARDDLHDKCVRILLEPGEPMPEIDCLQLSAKREVEEIELDAVGAQSFNVSEILNRELAEAELPEQVTLFIKESLGDLA